MQKNLSGFQTPSVAESCQDIQRGLLKLLMALTPRNKNLHNLDKGKAASPAFASVIEVDDWKKAVALWTAEGIPLLTGLSQRACPACDSNISHTVFQSYDGYHFNECAQCGTWYVPLNVDWALFERFFDGCPSARAVAKKATTGRMEQIENPDFSRFDKYFQSAIELLSTTKSKIRYLDIGCGVGHSLTAAKTAGMLPHGVEADPDAVALAKKSHEVVVGQIGDLPDGTYDVVSMWETLEHLADPLSMLNKAVARLSPGGLVAVTVPNLDATGLRVSREKCSYVYGGFNSPGHINLFNHRTIEKILKRAGLALIEVTYEFSTNSQELFGYLGGVAAADRPFGMATPPQLVADALNMIWPAVTLLEELAGTLPIMHCIACRIEDISLFSSKCDERSTARRERIIASANQQIEAFGDPEEIQKILQAEVNKRDQMLAEMQAEVIKRDQMLAEMQAEVTKRDQMLDTVDPIRWCTVVARRLARPFNK